MLFFAFSLFFLSKAIILFSSICGVYAGACVAKLTDNFKSPNSKNCFNVI